MATSTIVPSPPSRPAGRGVPRAVGALIGVLAVAAALAAGQLVAVLVSPASSPYLAVGDTVIRFSPQWLTEFAKTTFGTADKPILLAGMGVVIALVGAVAGIASRRRPTPGVAVVVLLGLMGLAAVIFAPTFAPLDLVAPAASLVAGVGAFRLLHRQALAAYPGTGADPGVTGSSAAPSTGTLSPNAPSMGTPSTSVASAEAAHGPSRRGVLLGSAAGVGAASLLAGAGSWLVGGGAGDSRAAVTTQLGRVGLTERAPAIPAGAAFPELGTPQFLTSNADFYRIDVALRIPVQSAQDWTCRVHGMVDRELTLTFADLLSRPLVERTITMTCVSNPVGGNLVSTANFIGVDLRELLLEAGVQPGADQLYSTSIDGWYTGTPVDVLMEPNRGAMLAIGMNGEALPPEHGFPVRMVTPGLYGYVSATKWLADLELTTFQSRQGYWLERGWAERGPIKTQSRIDFPKPFGQVPSGRVTVAGIAWSQPIGVSRVEVRMDGGAWQDAELSTEVSGRTWRMWRTEFDLASGSHTALVRATDANGVTQTDQLADPIPDGASGWPSLIFNAT